MIKTNIIPEKPGKLKFLSGSMLKLIAVIAMLADHTDLILFSDFAPMNVPLMTVGNTCITGSFIMYNIGRLALPIFCFLIAQGYMHTSNKKRYGLNLFLFALISELPFNMMISGQPFHIGKQNVYFTLFLGFLCIYISENITDTLRQFIALVALIGVTGILNTDYGVRGVVLILILYQMRNRPALQAIFSYPFLTGSNAAFVAFIPINMYNGKRGFIKSKALKYAFYLFYPVHIIILLFIKQKVF